MSFNYNCLHCGSEGGNCLECGKEFSFKELEKYKKEVKDRLIGDILKVFNKFRLDDYPENSHFISYTHGYNQCLDELIVELNKILGDKNEKSKN